MTDSTPTKGHDDATAGPDEVAVLRARLAVLDAEGRQARESVARFRSFFNQSPVAIVIHDAETGAFLDANPAALALYGEAGVDDLQCEGFWLEPPHSFVEAKALIHRAARLGPQAVPWPYRAPDGSTRWVQVHLAPMQLDARLCVLATSFDITEQRRAEEALGERMKKTRCRLGVAELMRREPDLAVALERAAPLVAAVMRWPGRAACRIGYAGTEYRMPGFTDSSPTLTAEILRDGSAVGDVSVQYFAPVPSIDGELFLREERELLEEVAALIGESAARRMGEAAIRESERFLAESQRIAHVGSWSLDHSTSRGVWSAETFRIFGHAPGGVEVTAAAFLEHVHPEDRALIESAFGDSVRQGQPGYEVEFRIVRANDGAVRHVLERGTHERVADGTVVRSMGTIQDVTERVQAAEAYRLLAWQMEQAPFAVLRTDTVRRVTWVNAAFTRLTGYSLEEMQGRVPGHVLQGSATSPETVAQIRGHLAVLEPFHVEILNYSRTGNPYWIELSVVPLRDRAGAHIGFVGFARDVTARVEATERLAALNEELEARVAERTREVRRQALALENSVEGVAIFGADGCLYSNEAQDELYGCTRECPGWDALVDEQSVPAIRAAVQGGAGAWSGDVVARRCDGTTFDAEVDLVRMSEGEVVMVTRDVTARRESERQLMMLKEQLELSLEAGQVGSWLQDLKTGEAAWDERLYKLVGHSPQDLPGGVPAWEAVLSPTDLAELRRLSAEAIPQLAPFGMQLSLQRGDADTRTLQLRAIVTPDANGRPARLAGIVFDITEMIEREKALEKLNAQLKEATRQKDEFLANMSHELRTPLNAILGMSEALQMGVYGDLNTRQAGSVRRVEDSGRHLLELINDVLDLAKIEAGRIVIEPERIRVPEMATNIMRLIDENAKAKGIRLTVSVDPRGEEILADPRRVRQVLLNLLSNALKFTPAGGSVTLETRVDVAGGWLAFSVSDTGEGIPADKLPLLFRPFTQLESTLTKRHAGTGLGLSIVKKLLELHGGRVGVESEFGRGSTFTVSFPWKAPATITAADGGGEGAPVAARTAAPRAEAPGAHILVVEDNPVNVEVVLDFLQNSAYRVTVACNGASALQMVEAQEFHLILMDVQMPEMDGLEATRRIRALPVGRTVPIIALTSFAMPGDRDRCLAAGMSDYLAKPVSLKALGQIVRTWLNRTAPT